MFLGCCLSARSRKQTMVKLSTAEAEYIALCDLVKELLWYIELLEELGFPQRSIVVHCDNQSAIAIAKNPGHHERTKHISTILSNEVDGRRHPHQGDSATAIRDPAFQDGSRRWTHELSGNIVLMLLGTDKCYENTQELTSAFMHCPYPIETSPFPFVMSPTITHAKKEDKSTSLIFDGGKVNIYKVRIQAKLRGKGLWTVVSGEYTREDAEDEDDFDSKEEPSISSSTLLTTTIWPTFRT
ncbi:Aste57867_5538 [Aphanomyces stellatus]|uniref:Aste57867_5538 protein n=1 Tax=Aphanomyces stellatus TaxID=120398 RepID=A0A485KEL8_9STRA|nr:hypothetical protein As57867_005525 [Aphanomyces stellatus]VFT82587.1 Aste57867_5538 [Aphanomyces stellatus]